jgi:PAS domain S-box-containing protein
MMSKQALVAIFAVAPALFILRCMWRASRIVTFPGGRWFLWLGTFAAGFCTLYGIQLAQDQLDDLRIWSNFTSLALVPMPLTLLFLASQYTNVAWRPKPALALWLLGPAVAVVGIVLDPQSDLWKHTFTTEQTGPLTTLVFRPGPLYLIWIACANAMILVAAAKMLTFRSRIHEAHRSRVTALIVGLFIGPFARMALWSGFHPFGALDFTSLAFAIGAALVTYAVGRGEVFDIVPIARAVVFEHIGEGVLVLDYQHRVVDVNPSALTLLGRAEQEVLNKPFAQVFPSTKVLEQAGSVEVKLTRNQLRFWQAEARKIFDHQGVLNGTVVVFSDISERKRYEESLEFALHEQERLASAANDANLAKTQFLANMSHEIRTPLNGILGMASLLGSSALTSAQRERLNLLESSGKSLLAIVDEILDISQIEAGKLRLESTPFSLTDLFNELVGVYRPLAETKSLTFEAIGPSAQYFALGDALRLKQILSNLLSNALKFTQSGSVAFRMILSHGETLGIRFEVADSGIGIPEDRQSAIFDNFEQADTSTTRRFGGTGLGLAICRRLAEMMGGTVGLRSEAGVGSTFWVELSLPSAKENAGSSLPAANQEIGQNIRVLLAEDNPVNVAVAVGLLEALGCHCLVATDGQEAIDLLSSEQIDLVLMDVQMPVLDGHAATRVLRQRGFTGPIVAMSASAMESDRQLAAEAGMNSFLGKPVRIAELTKVLADVSILQTPAEQKDPSKFAEAT